jgi:hypothetical protein
MTDDLETIAQNYEEVTGIHDACLAVPEMSAAEFRNLVHDISTFGLRDEIVLTEDGLLLDGRHRLRACFEAQLLPRFTSTPIDPWDYSVSANITRRHLTPMQRAMFGARLMEHYSADAKQRQIDSGKTFGRGAEKVVERVTPPISGKARDQAGAMVGVSGPLVDAAKKIIALGDEKLTDACMAGKLNGVQAKSEIKKRAAANEPAKQSLSTPSSIPHSQEPDTHPRPVETSTETEVSVSSNDDLDESVQSHELLFMIRQKLESWPNQQQLIVHKIKEMLFTEFSGRQFHASDRRTKEQLVLRLEPRVSSRIEPGRTEAVCKELLKFDLQTVYKFVEPPDEAKPPESEVSNDQV